MLIDTSTLPSDTIVENDICIIGAGAAGITLAREFINQPYQVCLLESGGSDFDEVTQSLYAGENIGVPYFPLRESRARYLGGSTNLWGGGVDHLMTSILNTARGCLIVVGQLQKQT